MESDERLRRKSADVIVITKALRMLWIDAMALDAAVSPTEFKIGAIIGTHCSNVRGDAFPGQPRLAMLARMSERTVWGAIIGLEDKGYLVVERHSLGTRKSDGRAVAGGRGRSNTYFPAFKRSKLVATSSGEKLAAHCDLILAQRSQKSAGKLATGCEITLSHPSDENSALSEKPGDKIEPTSRDETWRERLKGILGEAKFAGWCLDLHELVDDDEKIIRLGTSKSHAATYVQSTFQRQILKAFRPDRPLAEFVDVRFVPRPPLDIKEPA